MTGNDVLLFSIQVTDKHPLKSLELIQDLDFDAQDLDFDAIVPWVAIEGEGAVFFVENEEDKRNRLQKIIDRIRRGEHT